MYGVYGVENVVLMQFVFLFKAHHILDPQYYIFLVTLQVFCFHVVYICLVICVCMFVCMYVCL